MARTLARTAPAPASPTVRLYLRRSLDDEKQADSWDRQRAICNRFADSKGFPSVRAEYTDENRSGDDFTRPGLTAMIAATQPGDFILAEEDSRLGRGALMTALVVRNLCRDKGARVFYAGTGKEAVSANGTDDVINVVGGMGAEGMLEKIREGTQRALHERVRDGYAARFVAYGYRTVAVDATAEKSKKLIKIDEEQAAIVRRIFAEYVEGAGCLQVAKGLNADGVRGPSRTAERNGRKVLPVWTGETIRKMLRAPIYRGTVEYAGATYKRSELEILPPDLASRVDAAIAARATEGRPRHVVHPIAGWGRCSECGGSIASHAMGNGMVKYVCDRRRRVGDCDVKVRVPVEIVEGGIVEGIMADILNDEIISLARASIREAIRAQTARSAAASGADVAALRASLATAQDRKRRAQALALDSDDPDALSLAKGAAAAVRAIEMQIAAAERPAIDDVAAARIEADAVARLERIRDALTDRTRLREALRDLFPSGLKFTPDGDGWIISGDAVPCTSPALGTDRAWLFAKRPRDRGGKPRNAEHAKPQ